MVTCDCPQVNMVTPRGRVLTTGKLFQCIDTQLDNTRITIPGLPPGPRDTFVSDNDAANIVQELFVCAAFRTNKSFGRSLRGARASDCLNQ